MSTTTEIKFEFYIDSTSEQDTSNSLSPADATDLGLNAGVVVDQLGGGITFSNAGSIKGGKTDWDVGIGFWLGYQTDAYKVAIGDPANEKVTWDGDDLVIDIDASNLKINGSVGTQGIVVQSNGTVQFTSLVEELNDLSDVTGTTFSSTATKVLIPQSGNVYGFADLRSVTDSYIRLRDLSDVANTSPSDGHLLQYSSGNSLWTMVAADTVNAKAIGDLTDVTITNVADDQFLVYNSSTSNWENVSGTEVLSINDMNDVITKNAQGQQTAQSGQVLAWNPSVNGGSWVPTTSTVSGALNDLTDVTISSVADDHILQYNSSTSQFENVAIGTAVGAANLRFEDLSNAGTGTAQNNQFWRYNSSSSKYELTTFAIQELTNVALDNSLANGDILRYNSSTSQFENEALSGSGSAALQDADGDTKIQVEESSDEDKIRFDTAGSERMIINNAGDVSIGSSSNHSGARLIINDTPPTSFGYPMVQVGQETFTAGGVYSIGMGYTSDVYGNPPVEIAAKTLSSSGGTTADIIFGTRSVTTNAAVTERIRILKTGGITFDGETTSAHALDDYEEGTWTPHFADAASGGNYVTAGTEATGTFTKIGNVVHLACPAQNINPSGLTTSAQLFVRNFPFTLASSQLQTPCTSVNFAGRAAGSMVGAYFMAQPGNTYGQIIKPSSTGGGEDVQGVAQILSLTQIGGAYTAVRFSITYIAA